MKDMNLYSATRETLRRLIERHRVSRTIEKRTYVFIFVPLASRRNTHAKRAIIVGDDVNEKQLNYELMWTWFLRNPLWPPKKSK